MNKVDFLLKMVSLVRKPNPESLKLSMRDTHHKGVFSLVIAGTEFGKLTRVFICDTKIKPFEVQLHTHRYPIRITVIKGNVRHYTAFPTSINDAHTTHLSEFEYHSPLNGGPGLSYVKESMAILKDYSLPVGASIEMGVNEFHTMSCSKGSMWIVEELGFQTEKSKVLGVPFITENLYNEAQMFQINDKCQQVFKALSKLIADYKIIYPIQENNP